MKRQILGLAAVSIMTALVAWPLSAQGNARDWQTFNRTWAGERFSPLREITRANVGHLQEICAADIPDGRSFQSGLIVVDGVIFVTTDTATYAIDGATCAVKWSHHHPYRPASYLGANRGAAYLDGRLFRGSGDGHVFAINAANGASVWDVVVADQAKGETVPMAPLAWKGMVFVGNAGGDNFGVTGRVNALDAADGHVLWTFRTVPDTAEVRATWPKASALVPPTGGAFWTTFSLDPDRGILYVPAGNPAPDFARSLRPGRNLYTDSLIAIDARRGTMIGYNRPVEIDFHDWDVSASPALVTTRRGRRLALTAGKDGFLRGIDLRAFDRDGGRSAKNGGILYSRATTTHLNATRPLSDRRTTRFCPGTEGGSEWNGAAYHPGLNLAFVPAVDWCATVRLLPAKEIRGSPGKVWTGTGPIDVFGKLDRKALWKGWITAIDADSGIAKWKFRAPTPLLAGVTVTAGDLLFTADLAGTVYGFDARNGRPLWKGNAGQPVGGGVISYGAGGHQRIAVAAGMKSPLWPVMSTAARVVVFGLK